MRKTASDASPPVKKEKDKEKEKEVKTSSKKVREQRHIVTWEEYYYLC